MEDLRSLKAIQLDALREVANIGAGHAATALSQMTGETIMICATINSRGSRRSAADHPARSGAAVRMPGSVTLPARTRSSSRNDRGAMSELLLRRPQALDRTRPPASSALKEAGKS